MAGLLIFIGLILIILNVLAIKKQNKSFNGVLGNAIGNIQDDDIRIGELRREFSESILELQSELMEIKEVMKVKEHMEKNYSSINKNYQSKQDESKKLITIDVAQQDKDTNKIIIDEFKQVKNNNKIMFDGSHNNSSEKVNEIKRLFNEGSSVDEVSEILHLGKGEVLLIKDLYIK
ncbi:MAG TPA: hypothetical protein VIM70_07150 [Clostridium sp.]|uniref:DUF6115 domain-containing protein n=1 Tax=Clostridium sp. TaxID=1506 RepID=UPI002F948F6C